MASAKVLDALALSGIRLLAGGTVWLLGFRAVSDDDYARIVIAQRFAHDPALDPSGTSWLPFPFWLQGGSMLLFGTEVETARAVALLSGVLSTLLVWQAAHWLGLNRSQAFIGAAVAAVFPYSARLGVATVPEQLTAGLVLVGAASLAVDSTKRRALGGIALMLATLARYEAWPIAVAFAGFCCRDAWISRRKKLAMPAGLASLGMLLWLLHGLVRHGDATFFVKRVQHYQQALGMDGLHFWQAATHYPALVWQHEPELVLVSLLGLFGVFRAGRQQELAPFKRPAWLMLAMLIFLIVGDLRSTAATHHAERALLPLWTLLALMLGATWPILFRHVLQQGGTLKFPRRASAAMLLLICALLGIVWLRPRISDRGAFVDRSDEIVLGKQARQLAENGRLLIIARDYGFFAMIAGFGDPSRAVPLDDLDPRRQRIADPFDDSAAFAHHLRQQQVRALIAPASRRLQALRLGHIAAKRGGYLLIAIEPLPESKA